MGRSSSGIALVALLLLGAADPKGDKSAAKRLLDEGNVLFENGQFETALAKYVDAHKAYASPKIRLNIAEAYRQLGKNLASLEQYEQFIAEAEAKDGALKETAQARIAELAPLIGSLALEGVPEGAAVTIDGTAKTGPYDKLRLDSGRHEVVVTASGQAPFRATSIVKAGQVASLKVALTAAAPAEVVAVAPAPAPVEEEKLHEKWWFWAIVGGVVVTGAAIGLGVGLSGGSDTFDPSTELGRSKVSTW